MTIVPKYENIRAEESRTLRPKQTAVESVLKSDGGNVAKVLGLTCDVVLLSAECVGGEVRYSGRADFKAVFSDTSGQLNTLSYYADFNDKIEDEFILPVSQIFCKLNVMENEVSSFNADEIKIACVIEAVITVSNTSMVPVLSGGDGFFYNNASLNTTSNSGTGKGICEVSEEFDVKGTVTKILLTEAGAIITNCSAGVDSVTAEGEICVRITYFTGGDNGGMESVSRTIPFRHEVECKNALPQDKTVSDCTVKTLKVNAMVDGDKAITALSITVETEITVNSFSGFSINYIDDAFSPDSRLNMTFASINTKTFIESFNFRHNIEGTASLDGDMLPADNVLAAGCNRIHIANVMAAEGSVTIEGIASATVIYSGSKDDAILISSANVEIPFSESFAMAAARTGDTVNVSAAVCDVSAKSRKGTEIEVGMVIKIRADLYTDEVITALAEIEQGEGEMPRMASISIYCPSENEGLWDIAKQLSVAPDTVTQFNPELKFPAGANARIFVYRQKF